MFCPNCGKKISFHPYARAYIMVPIMGSMQNESVEQICNHCKTKFYVMEDNK
jgi:hypothetical protein